MFSYEHQQNFKMFQFKWIDRENITKDDFSFPTVDRTSSQIQESPFLMQFQLLTNFVNVFFDVGFKLM